MNRKIFSALLICVLAASAAFAAEGDYIIRDRQAYRVDGGKETLLEDAEIQWAGTDAGLWAWILVDPELSEEMKGSEAAIYFFRGEEAEPAGFLPMKNAGTYALDFSPSGEKLLIAGGMETKRELGFYLIEDGGSRFVKKASFSSLGRAFWIDPHRFVFGCVDENKGPRMKEWTFRGNEGWWCSVAMYDTLENTLTVFEETTATSTRNFVVTECDEESGTLEIWEHFVKDEKDWEEEGKIEDRDFRIPIPAAG